MKQLLLLLLLLLLGLHKVQAQQYFNRRYTLNAYATALSSIVPRDGKYYCTGMAFDSSNTSSVIGVKFAILDSFGSVIKDTIYQRLGVRNFYAQYNNSLYPMPDKGFLLGVAQDGDPTTGIMYALLIRYDSTGNILWAREYPKPFCSDTTPYYSIADIKPTGTGEWLMLCTVQCPTDASNPMFYELTKLDNNFNVEWCKKYGYPSRRNRATKIVIENNGYLLGGGVTNYSYIGMTGIKWQALMIKTDTAGNEQWKWKSDTTKMTGNIQDLIRTTDGGYVYCGLGNGYEDDASGSGILYWKGWIEKLDSNKNVAWFDTVDYFYNNGAALTVLKELSDNTVVCGGNLVGGFNNDPTNYPYSFACLLRYKQDGKLIFQRKYSHSEDSLSGAIYDLKQTPDGGYILCGDSKDYNFYYGSNLQQAWVLKVDSRGCESLTDPQCAHDAVAPIARQEIAYRVYPNPVKDVLTVECPGGAAGAVFLVIDVFGRTVFSKTLAARRERIDTHDWPPGVYIYHVLWDGGSQAGKIVK